MFKKYSKLILKVLVSGVLLAIIFLKTDKQLFLEKIQLLDLKFIPLIIFLLILNYVISSIRWKQLLIFKNGDKVSVKYLTSLYFIGSFFNNFMPTSIGGDVFKFAKLGKKIGSKTHAFSATFMERFTGVLVLALISMFSLVGVLEYWTILLLVWFVGGFYLGIKILQRLGSKFKQIGKIYNSLIEYKGKYKVLSWAIVTSVVVQIIAILTQYFIFYALGIKLPITYSLFVFPIITLASFFIPSLNGLGVQDALYMNLFLFVGVTTELALSASILYHLFRLSVSLIGGVLYAMGKDE